VTRRAIQFAQQQVTGRRLILRSRVIALEGNDAGRRISGCGNTCGDSSQREQKQRNRRSADQHQSDSEQAGKIGGQFSREKWAVRPTCDWPQSCVASLLDVNYA
jgi:hypothetical protein